ncbi:hypothetical protein D3C81_1392180 [compost metagenome]
MRHIHVSQHHVERVATLPELQSLTPVRRHRHLTTQLLKLLGEHQLIDRMIFHRQHVQRFWRYWLPVAGQI